MVPGGIRCLGKSTGLWSDTGPAAVVFSIVLFKILNTENFKHIQKKRLLG